MTHATTWPEGLRRCSARRAARLLARPELACASYEPGGERRVERAARRVSEQWGWRPSDVTRDRVHRHRARTNPVGEHARVRALVVAYRGSNGPLLLTKQAQHSTNQYYPLMFAQFNGCWGRAGLGLEAVVTVTMMDCDRLSPIGVCPS